MTHRKDACPDCGRDKSVEASWCKPCAGKRRRTAEHGTDSRYVRHLRDGEKPCEPCRLAHNAATNKAAKERAARRRREREAERKAKVTCPSCGGPKSSKSTRCRKCHDPRAARRKGLAQHGTESGYYRHIRQTGVPSPDWPKQACDECLAARAEAASRRDKGKPRKRRPSERTPSRRVCRDCGKSISASAQRCRRCARLHQLDQKYALPTRWRRVGLIWKAA